MNLYKFSINTFLDIDKPFSIEIVETYDTCIKIIGSIHYFYPKSNELYPMWFIYMDDAVERKHEIEKEIHDIKFKKKFNGMLEWLLMCPFGMTIIDLWKWI